MLIFKKENDNAFLLILNLKPSSFESFFFINSKCVAYDIFYFADILCIEYPMTKRNEKSKKKTLI